MNAWTGAEVYATTELVADAPVPVAATPLAEVTVEAPSPQLDGFWIWPSAICVTTQAADEAGADETGAAVTAEEV